MSDDYGFLETVFISGMLPGDFLLLEVRCHVNSDAGTAPGIGDEAKRRFNFGPLEVLGADYDAHRDLITIRRERSRSVIPNTVTTVTRCERVRGAGMTWRDVRLAYVHEYSEPDLDRVLSDIGYTAVRKFAAATRQADQEGGDPRLPAAQRLTSRPAARKFLPGVSIRANVVRRQGEGAAPCRPLARGDPMTQYLLSVHMVEGEPEPAPEELQRMYKDVDAFNDELKAQGAWVFAGGLHPADTATVVRVDDGEVLTTDGPFAETKEQLGGFWIVEASDLDAALALAAKGSTACKAPVEVRPFQEDPQD